jgi:hypothetical protein
MPAVTVFLSIAGILLIYWSYRMSAALDRLTASVQANVIATNVLIAAFQAAPSNQEPAINLLADQVDANTAAVNAALGTTPPTP